MSQTAAPQQSDSSFEAINQLVWQHLLERGWTHNPPRGLASSIVLEASELLEHYQWSDEPIGDKQALSEELADILIYCFAFAQQTDIDMVTAVKDKLIKSGLKYPAEAFAGKTDAENHLAWVDAKLNHHKSGL